MTAPTAPARYTDYVPLSSLAAAPRNPKAHAKEDLAHSISRWGFADSPILDERTGRLVAGHGRAEDLAARRADGGDPPDGIQVDGDEWLVPVQRGWASRDDAEAEAFVVAHNRITERGGWQEDLLLEVLSEMAAVDDGLLGTGFDDGYLEDLLVGLEGRDDIRDFNRPDQPAEPKFNTDGLTVTAGFTGDGARKNAGHRLLVLDLTVEQFAWLVTELEKLAMQMGDGDQEVSNQDVIFRLVADRTGVTPPGDDD